VKRFISWFTENADVVIGLGLAVFASILGILGAVPGDVIANVTVLTLATLAFVMLRDRHRQETASREIGRSVTRAKAELLKQFASSQKASAVRILDGAEITHALDESRADTEQLIFKGATGTFTRAVALPECLKLASRDHRTLRARLEIFDPGNEQLLESYVELYQSFAGGPDDPQAQWSVDGTRREILATILAACWQREQHRLHLDIEVFLSSSLTTFRWDLTSKSLIITQRGPRFPALFFSHDDAYYWFWSTELHANTQAAKRLPLHRLDGERSCRLGPCPESSTVRALFDLLDISLPAAYNDTDVDELIQEAIHGRNPYP
jgi:hypothetical protein